MQSMPPRRATPHAPAPAPLGEFEQLLLLAILQCGNDAYTVPIRTLLSERAGRDVARGALFTTLDRLEAKGLVTSRMGEALPVRGGRPRRYFTVTTGGVASLRAARAALRLLSEGLDAVLER
jgi:DNA-binding PadR family transcriptional regulator